MLYKFFITWARIRIIHFIFNYIRKRKNPGKFQLKTMGLVEYALEIWFARFFGAGKMRKGKSVAGLGKARSK